MQYCCLLGLLQEKIPKDIYRFCFLVIAGGYDIMNGENIAHFVELQEKAITLNLHSEQYVFLKSPSTLLTVCFPQRIQNLALYCY